MKSRSELYNVIPYIDPEYPLVIFRDSGFSASENYYSTQLFHEDIEIKYYTSGPSAIMINNRIYTVSAGDIAVVNPYDLHANICLDGNGATYSLFNLGLDFFTKRGAGGLNLRTELLQKHMRFSHIIRGNTQLSELLLRIKNEDFENKPYCRLMIARMMEEFFILLLRSYLVPDDEMPERGGHEYSFDLLTPALQRIHAGYSEPLSVHELAEVCGLSDSHFSHLFSSTFDQSPITYLNSYRIRIADMLYQTSEKDTAEIARLCGFQDTNYFYRCYKKFSGSSVRQRKKNES